ncbi:MAG: hypothetical protein EA365_06430 [Gloeocapsa sp. DLM2.Bin57]|nr:MAG: hypothetical protein EA365_06430 [Gloeocapsa sp. DLM2.Bin57]
MNKRDFLNMSDEERLKALAEMPDEDIDYSDIPELDEEFLANTKFIRNPFNLKNSAIEVEIINWFKSKAGAKNYYSLINKVLKE